MIRQYPSEEEANSSKLQRIKVFNLMKDGKWHAAQRILGVAGGTEGLRRMRELREIPGIFIEKKRSGLSRTHYYRMVDTRDE